MKTIQIKEIKRECGACTACCEGWLAGEVYGKKFSSGVPCHFVSENKCSIYKDRPQDPCKNYNFEWLVNQEFPMWMKPNVSKVIITKKIVENIEFYSINNTGEEMTAQTLNWLINWAMPKQLNLIYRIQGGICKMGSPEFNQLNIV